MRVFTPEETATWYAGLEKRMSSSAVALYDEQDQVLIVRTNYHDYWSFPGGIIDAKESPLHAAVREVSEEVGINISPESLQFCFVADHASSSVHSYQFVFESKIPSIGSVHIDEDEIEEYEVVSRQQILDNDRKYSDTLVLWAQGHKGYVEHSLDSLGQIDV